MRGQAVRDSTTGTNHLLDLGFNINWAKSQVEPTQCTEYLGLNINSFSYLIKVNVSHIVPLPLLAGKSHDVQAMPATARSHGFSNFCCTSGASDDEGFSMLGNSTAPVPPQPLYEDNTSMGDIFLAKEGRDRSCVRCLARGGIIQGYHDNGHVPVRVGGATLLGRAVNGILGPRLAQA